MVTAYIINCLSLSLSNVIRLTHLGIFLQKKVFLQHWPTEVLLISLSFLTHIHTQIDLVKFELTLFTYLTHSEGTGNKPTSP